MEQQFAKRVDTILKLIGMVFMWTLLPAMINYAKDIAAASEDPAGVYSNVVGIWMAIGIVVAIIMIGIEHVIIKTWRKKHHLTASTRDKEDNKNTTKY